MDTLAEIKKILYNSAERGRLLRRYGNDFYNNQYIEECYQYIFNKIDENVIRKLSPKKLKKEIKAVTPEEWQHALFDNYQNDDIVLGKKIFKSQTSREEMYIYCFAKIVEKNRRLFVKAVSDKSSRFYTIPEDEPENKNDAAEDKNAGAEYENTGSVCGDNAAYDDGIKSDYKGNEDINKLLEIIKQKDKLIEDLKINVKRLEERVKVFAAEGAAVSRRNRELAERIRQMTQDAEFNREQMERLKAANESMRIQIDGEDENAE